jgi:molybdopterin converting factor small subunit
MQARSDAEPIRYDVEPLVTVRVLLMGELRRWAGRRELEVGLPQGSTVQALTERLPALCGQDFARRVMTREGSLQPHVAVFVDGVQIGSLKGNQTVLTDGSVELMLLPMYEGGA